MRTLSINFAGPLHFVRHTPNTREYRVKMGHFTREIGENTYDIGAVVVFSRLYIRVFAVWGDCESRYRVKKYIIRGDYILKNKKCIYIYGAMYSITQTTQTPYCVFTGIRSIPNSFLLTTIYCRQFSSVCFRERSTTKHNIKTHVDSIMIPNKSKYY